VTKQAISHDDKETLLFRTTFDLQNSTEAKQVIDSSLKELEKSYQILDLLKKSIFTTNSHIIGQAKQILTYRDWVAHGKNPNKLPSSNITARFAYKILNKIVETLLLN